MQFSLYPFLTHTCSLPYLTGTQAWEEGGSRTPPVAPSGGQQGEQPDPSISQKGEQPDPSISQQGEQPDRLVYHSPALPNPSHTAEPPL